MMKLLKRLLLLLLVFSVFTGTTCFAVNQQELINENLMNAIRYGNLEEAQKWLSYGGDINYRGKDGTDEPAVSLACAKTHEPDMLFFVIKHGADINARHDYYTFGGISRNATPLLSFCALSSEGSTLLAKILLANGADATVTDDDGNTALERISRFGTFRYDKDFELTRALLYKGCDPNQRNKDGFTPLLWLSHSRDFINEPVALDFARVLIQNGANPNATMVYNGKTYKCSDFALENNDLKMYEFFKNAENNNSSSTNTVSSTKQSLVNDFSMSEIKIGRIAPEQTLTQVEEVYGKPENVMESEKQKIYTYNGGSFFVIGELIGGRKEYIVSAVYCFHDGQQTPSGFKVGMPFEKVIEKYGKASGSPLSPSHLLYKQLKGAKEYPYFCKNEALIFTVDKNQIIRGMAILKLMGKN